MCCSAQLRAEHADYERYVGTSGAWVRVQNSAAVPINTRYVRFVIDMKRNAGTSNDGYMDDLSAYIE